MRTFAPCCHPKLTSRRPAAPGMGKNQEANSDACLRILARHVRKLGQISEFAPTFLHRPGAFCPAARPLLRNPAPRPPELAQPATIENTNTPQKNNKHGHFLRSMLARCTVTTTARKRASITHTSTHRVSSSLSDRRRFPEV